MRSAGLRTAVRRLTWALANGVSREQVALDITQSPEAQVHLVGQIEQGTLLVA